ncbi:hypothetical protein A2U01_0079939, partial [Trifolium medium]|nr:hypothetical protein [Trifolium medium]
WYRVLVARYGEEAGMLREGVGPVRRGGGRLCDYGMAWVMMGRGGGLRRVLNDGWVMARTPFFG